MNNKKAIQNFIRSYSPEYLVKNKVSRRIYQALNAQINCRTASEGHTRYRCLEDGTEKTVYHSCRHRGCSICGGVQQYNWLEQEKNRLLDKGHFHLVFTLPSEYRELWLYNRSYFIQAHFSACHETLRDLLEPSKDPSSTYPSYLDATPGYLMVLHTWGRQLNLHPHIHCLVSAGGIDDTGDWKDCEGDFLLPVKVVKALYRGKFQAKINALLDSPELNLPSGEDLDSLRYTHKQLYKKEWSVRIEKQYAQGEGVLKYLARYLGGRCIRPEQIFSMENDRVGFHYKDHRDGRYKPLYLTEAEFMRRLMLHQPDRGIHTIRHYGLYHAQNKKRQYCEAFQAGNEKESTTGGISHEFRSIMGQVRHYYCECCGAVMEPVSIVYRRGRIENSLIKGITPKHRAAPVQQGDQADQKVLSGFT